MYDCVIPAAGASSRMGAFKPLLPFGSDTILGTTVDAARAAGCRILLVVGYRGAELTRVFEGRPGLLIVENPRWEEGMLGSIQAALPRVEGSAFFTIPADMPFVPSTIYATLARAREEGREPEETQFRKAEPGSGGFREAGAQRSPSERAYFAAQGGRAGHPVLIPSSWIGEILALPRDARMRVFLEGRPRLLVETGSPAVFADLDRPEEYRARLNWPGGD